MKRIDHHALSSHGSRPTKNSSFFQSLKNAWNGINAGLKESSHVRFHFYAGIFALLLSVIFGLNPTELAIIILLIGVIIFAELVNSAIENHANLLRDKAGVPYEYTGLAKDIGAGAVLVLAIISIAIAILIFAPKVLLLLQFLF